MREFEAIIGLEVHVHLATKSKLFCSCSAAFGKEPNTNVCEICTGMPGALPVLNKQAIKLAAILGLATHCSINKKSVFARKNYFYPDLPNGYQISQFNLPICENGYLLLDNDKKIGITRIHMENDAGKNIHSDNENISFVDLNRAGVPLVEIVSEPDMRSPEEAVQYLKKLHNLVTYLEISDGNMEEGSFRCDANISLRLKGSVELGTRTELKNLNSFRHVQKALEHEITRQEDLLIDGKEIIQETRLYNADKDLTQSMRSKEEAEDYRYFPDPDLLPVEISSLELSEWERNLAILPDERIKTIILKTKIPYQEALQLVQNRYLADMFDKVSEKIEPKKVASFLLGPVFRLCNENNIPLNPKYWKITETTFVDLLQMVENGEINNKIAADILPAIFINGEDPRQFVKKNNLIQISDENMIVNAVTRVLAANPEEVKAYKSGKTKLISFFMGQIMRETKGKANPGLVTRLLQENLNKE